MIRIREFSLLIPDLLRTNPAILAIIIAAAVTAAYLWFLRKRWHSLRAAERPTRRRLPPRIRVLDIERPSESRTGTNQEYSRERICQSCGASLRDESLFCDRCGSRQ